MQILQKLLLTIEKKEPIRRKLNSNSIRKKTFIELFVSSFEVLVPGYIGNTTHVIALNNT